MKRPTLLAALLLGSPALAAAQQPYPLPAAGWGPELGRGLMASRWAEDWHAARAAGQVPAFKAIGLDDDLALTLSAEGRARFDRFDNAQLQAGNDYRQMLWRGVLGAELRAGPHWRVYGELASGQVGARQALATANFQNTLALQQAFAELRGGSAGLLAGAMLGRQEFADGPRQLVSLSDGPNLHRSWNGVRAYLQTPDWRLSLARLRATRLGSGRFDETVNPAERLDALTGSLRLGDTAYLDPFWYRSENPAFRLAGRAGADTRHTAGARLWGRQGALRYEWTGAVQRGDAQQRPVRAWALFAVHSLALSEQGWKPRLTARLDLASGGGSYGSGTVHSFNPLYASSNYLGEGQFLGLSNLAMLTPGLALAPSPRSSLNLDYGIARRRDPHDAAYGGGQRPYARTAALPGREIGSLWRVIGSWSPVPAVTLFVNLEQLRPGALLRSAALPGARYVYLGASYRY
ncbi:alginate export family protein [Massilia sp. SM-13]|uniref:alginate export family protein n=1 Tax=Pseudoduganella rhizocola TaxID=3382643 RepID=UPI0038B54C9D